ncbi:MAG: NAD-dependent epimerase/dehydratase family protein [Cellvibrionaceae bacterium]
MSKDRLVITGETGFVGSHLVHSFSEKSNIVSINRRELLNRQNVSQLVVPSLAQDLHSIAERVPLESTFIHCAASINPKEVGDYWSANVVATRELLELAVARKAKQFILFSTGGVYGYRDGELAQETDSLDPIGIYGHSKVLAEQLANMYSQEYGLNVVVFRLYFPFAEGQRKGIFPLIKSSIKNRSMLTLNVDGAPKLQPVHCDDIVSAVEQAMDKCPEGYRVYNLCGDEVFSFADLVDEYALARGVTASVKQSTNTVGDLLACNRLLKKELEWRPEVSCKEFIRFDANA